MEGNILKITTIPRNSEWWDKDAVLLHACFQILVDFIEKERPQRIVDYNHDRKHRMEWKELQTLYRYWKKERPKLEKDAHKALMKSGIQMVNDGPPTPGAASHPVKFIFKDKKAYRLHNRLDDKLQRLDDEMLQRLINIRQDLWC